MRHWGHIESAGKSRIGVRDQRVLQSKELRAALAPNHASKVVQKDTILLCKSVTISTDSTD